MGKKKPVQQQEEISQPSSFCVLPYPANQWQVPDEMVVAVTELEKSLSLPVYLLIQDGNDEKLNSISPIVK